MASISLCMIVKNEEETLPRCLESVKGLTDEIIIVDTGSEDGTKKAAAGYTDRIYDYVWKDDFSAARNYAFEKGECDYLMWMDADDVIPEGEREKFLEMKNHLPPDTDIVMMPYAVSFDESGNSTFTYYRERIVRNKAGYLFAGRVHEVIPPAGKILYSDVRIEHRKLKTADSGRNLRIYEDMEAKGERFDSRALYYYGRELAAHRKYRKGIKVLKSFLKRPDGWKENRIDACRQLAFCYYGLNDEEKALGALFSSFEIDVPRGEICCDLGRHFMDRGSYGQAVYWLKQALEAKRDMKSGAFIQEDCYGFLPAILLCVCFDRMGDLKQAEKYNELAGRYNPASFYYRENRDYLRKKQKKNLNIY